MDLDSLDHQIMMMLAQDGRATNVDIGSALRVSHSTVKKRIDRLVDGGACRVLALVDPETLGYRTTVLSLIKASPGRGGQLAAELGALPEVYWLGQTIGRFDLFVEMVLRSPEEMFDLLARTIGPTPGVAAMDSLVAMRQTWWKPLERRVAAGSRASGRVGRWEGAVWRGETGSYRRGALGREERPGPARLDDVDLRIIGLLQENGRRSAAEIARLVRLSQPAVTNRIEKLVDKGVCRIVGVIEPKVLGRPVGAHILVRAEPDKIVEVGEGLSRLAQISWLCHTSGVYDLVAKVHMAGVDQVLEFTGVTLAEIPGVRSAEVLLGIDRGSWRPAAWRPPNGQL